MIALIYLLVLMIWLMPLVAGLTRLYKVVNNPGDYYSGNNVKTDLGLNVFGLFLPIFNFSVMLDIYDKHEIYNKKGKPTASINDIVYDFLKKDKDKI